MTNRFYDSRGSIASVDAEEINTMKLYYEIRFFFPKNLSHTQHFRARNELAARGKLHGSLTVDELMSFDQLHYHGPQVIDFAATKLGFKAGDRVLDIGAGIGGAFIGRT